MEGWTHVLANGLVKEVTILCNIFPFPDDLMGIVNTGISARKRNYHAKKLLQSRDPQFLEAQGL